MMDLKMLAALLFVFVMNVIYTSMIIKYTGDGCDKMQCKNDRRFAIAMLVLSLIGVLTTTFLGYRAGRKTNMGQRIGQKFSNARQQFSSASPKPSNTPNVTFTG